MSDGITQQLDSLVYHLDGIQLDDDGSQGLPSSVNVRYVSVIPQARDTIVYKKEILTVCLWLNQDGAFTYETVIDVLTGLTNCSVADFVKLFDFLLLQSKLNALDTDIHEDNTFKQIKAILSMAVDAYHSLCTQGKWHVSNKSSGHVSIVCWNCKTEGCSVNKCPQPKGQ